MKHFVGNGVILLGHPDNDHVSTDKKILKQYFSKAEQEVIYSSADFMENAWILWSCKKTAFKIMKKQNTEIKFDAKSIQVNPFGGEYAPSHHTIYTRVSTGYGPVFTETRVAKNKLATIGANDINALHRAKHETFIVEEKDKQSDKIRGLLIEQVREEFQLSNEDLTIEKDKFGIPHVLQDGKELDLDISISHNHGLSAYIFLAPE